MNIFEFGKVEIVGNLEKEISKILRFDSTKQALTYILTQPNFLHPRSRLGASLVWGILLPWYTELKTPGF